MSFLGTKKLSTNDRDKGSASHTRHISILTKYLPKLETTESLDHDYGFLREEITCPAVYPHMLSLNLESMEGI
jgi:hypothetical protein